MLSELIRGLGGVGRAAEMAKANLGTLRLAVASVGAVWAGEKIISGMVRMVEHGRELNKELEKTKQLGGDFAAQIDRTRAQAIQASISVPTTTPSSNVRMQRELGVVLGKSITPEETTQILVPAAKIAHVVSHYTGEDEDSIIKNLVKVADIRAKIFSEGPDGKERVDPTLLRNELNAAMKGLILGGNYLKSGDLKTMSMQAGVPAKTMTPEAFYAGAVEMAVSSGAARTGTAITSLFSQLIGGVMPQRVAQEMTRMGMMKSTDYTVRRGGSVVLNKGVEKKFEGVMTDPIGYITGPLFDLMKSRHMSQQDMMMEVYKLFGRQTTQRLVAEALSAWPQFARAREMFHDIPDADRQYKELVDNDLETNIVGFQKAWQGLMEVLGETGVPLAIGVLHSLTEALHFFTEGAAKFPLVTNVAMGIAAFSGVLLSVSGAAGLALLALSPMRRAIALLAGTSVASAAEIAAADARLAMASRAAAMEMTGAAAAAGTAGTRIGMLSGILGGLSAAALAVYAGIEGMRALHDLGVDKPEHDKELEELNKQRRVDPMAGQPGDGYDVEGRPVVPNVTALRDGPRDRTTALRAALPPKAPVINFPQIGDGRRDRDAAQPIQRELRGNLPPKIAPVINFPRIGDERRDRNGAASLPLTIVPTINLPQVGDGRRDRNDVAIPRVPSPPTPANSNAGPTEGDVYLDGRRVGRWISDKMAREAARPSTGTTGPDPRMTPDLGMMGVGP